MAFDVTPTVRDIIGVGIRTPFQFSVGRGVKAVSTSNGLDKIQASIRDILTTRPGERLMQPEYGSRLFDLVFEPNDFVTNQLLYIYTAEALQRWEPRIQVTGVTFATDNNNPNYVGICVNFLVLATHQQGSYVFPFTKTGSPMSLDVTGTESQRIFTQGQVLPPTVGTALNPGVSH